MAKASKRNHFDIDPKKAFRRALAIARDPAFRRALAIARDPAFIAYAGIFVTVIIFFASLRPQIESLRIAQEQYALEEQRRLDELERGRIGRISSETLRNVHVNMDVAKFIEQLGVPISTWNKEPGLKEYYFASPGAYVTAITRQQESLVFAFSITVRDPDSLTYDLVHPIERVAGPRLGLAGFDELHSFLAQEPVACSSYVGARRYGQLEAYYFGNPGLYMQWIYGINDAGAGLPEVVKETSDSRDCQQPALRGTVNTVAVISRNAPEEADSMAELELGVDLDKVRHLGN